MAEDRSDRKLKLVAVASFPYRHEAEFAAGFLEDARIRYRLQVDDPALGMPLSASATLWVTAMDAERARRVLDMEGGVVHDVDGPADPHHPAQEDGGARQGDVDGRLRGAGGGDRTGEVPRPAEAPSPASPISARAESPRSVPGSSGSRLSVRERLLTFGLSVAGWSLSRLEVVATAPGGVQASIAVASFGLLVIALFGRAPSAIRGILSTLSGDAP